MREAQLRTARILWLAIAASVAMFGVVLVVAVKTEGPLPPVLPLLTAEMLGVGLALSSFLVPIVTRGQRENILRAARGNEELARSAAGAMYRTNLILRLALAEAVGLIGFVEGFTSRVPSYAWPFLGVSLAVIGWHFPTARRMFAPR